MGSEISIFGGDGRTDATPSKHTESTYSFLRRAAGPVWDQCRALIDDWLSAYPPAERIGLIARLRSSNDRVFTSAFWELYLHEMYRRSGWTIQIEPEVAGVTTRPDFLVSKADVNYYVEARCTFEGGTDLGAAARLQRIYDSLNEIDSGAFYLSVTTLRTGSNAPSMKKLRRDLEAWLRSLDPDAGDYTFSDGRPERVYEWMQDDWHLVFRPIPRAASVRDVSAQRPLGAFIPAAASFVDDITTLREALSEKGSKYGDLKHPLVLAINIGGGFHDDDDTLQALYGTLAWRLNSEDPYGDLLPFLRSPGYWGWADQPAHTNVAGVLLAEGLHYGRVASYAPAYWGHPHAAQAVEPFPTWRVAEPTESGLTYRSPAIAPYEHFGLPEGWPVGERFPRDRDRPS